MRIRIMVFRSTPSRHPIVKLGTAAFHSSSPLIEECFLTFAKVHVFETSTKVIPKRFHHLEFLR